MVVVVAGDATEISCVNEESCLATGIYNSILQSFAEGFTSGVPEHSSVADSEDDSAADSEQAPHSIPLLRSSSIL